MHRREWLAVATVILGLAILAVAAGDQGSVVTDRSTHWGVLVAVTFVLGLGQVLVRRLGAGAAPTAGLLAGLLFGALAIAVRIVDGLAPLHWGVLVADPAAWAVAVAGVGGFYLHTVALQLGSVNGATAALVVGETVVPGIVGVVLLGDTSRPGLGWLAGTGFVLAVAAAIAVAAFGSETSQRW
jgi:drug/metabolite transporter (DMT)-like permease